MDNEIADWLENIDAAIFSGCKIDDIEAVKEVQEYVVRWDRELKRRHIQLLIEDKQGG